MTTTDDRLDALRRIWSRVLDGAPVEPDSDFFELGGDSLAAVEVITTLAEEMALEVSLSDFFEAPTPAELATRLVATQAPASGREGATVTTSLRQDDSLDLRLTQPLIGTGRVVPTRFRVLGEPSAARLAEALRRVAVRHEVLRSAFERHDDAWRARISEAGDVEVPVDVVDATSWSDADVDDDVVTWGNAPFAADAPCLLRARYYRRRGDDELVLVTSHLVFDGASLPILASDLSAFHRGGPDALPPLPAQYYDIAAAQRAALARGDLDESLAYWKRTMEAHGAWPRIELPGLRGRASDEPAPAASAAVALSPDEAAAFHDMCRRWGVSAYSGALAAMTSAVEALGGPQGDGFGVLVITSGRSWPHASGLIGFFTDYVTLGLGRPPAPPADRAADVHARVATALRHDVVPRREIRALAPQGQGDVRPHEPLVLFDKLAERTRWSIPLADGELVEPRGVPPVHRVRPYPGLFAVTAPLPDGRLLLECEYGVGECEPSVASELVAAWRRVLLQWAAR